MSWKKGSSVQQAETLFSTYIGGAPVITYDSGRTALQQALLALGVGEGDEVLVQAFTCVVVINAIRWTGATPVYVDIEKHTLNIDPTDARKKVTSNTKALIVQHTFGLPADIDALLSLAKEYDIRTIEDCAHSLGARYKGKLTGTFADIGMYSFGGEKNISCVRGGALIAKDEDIRSSLQNAHSRLPTMKRFTIFQHLFHVILFPLGKKWYHVGIGKVLLKVAKELHLTNKIITTKEKQGIQAGLQSSKLPNALAALLVSQIATIDDFNTHRRRIAHIYMNALKESSIALQDEEKGRVYLRFPIFVNDQSHVMKHAKNSGVLLGNWYTTVIAPGDCSMVHTGYASGACPNAEEQARHVVNLPTNIHISEEDAQTIVQLITE